MKPKTLREKLQEVLVTYEGFHLSGGEAMRVIFTLFQQEIEECINELKTADNWASEKDYLIYDRALSDIRTKLKEKGLL